MAEMAGVEKGISRPDVADVVVIGGGIIGCSAAYHLARMGAGRVVLLERAAGLGLQTSGSGAGFVSLWASEVERPWDALELGLERYGLTFYRELGAVHDIGLKEVGMARIALGTEEARRQHEQYEGGRARLAPGELELLSPREVAEVTRGAVEPARVSSALYWPDALRVNTSLTVDALGRELEALGVSVRTGTAVTGIGTDGGRVTGVETTRGRISTPVVVVAAGAWLGELAAMVGAALSFNPLIAVRFTTEPVPGLPAAMPMLIFADYYDMWVREEGGGLLAGTYYEDAVRARRRPSDPLPSDITELPTDLGPYAHDLALGLAPALPAFAGTRLKTVRAGLPAYTTDGRHLLGPVDGVSGLYVVGGDNEAGISHGPGLGRLAAELVVAGKASQDISAFAPGRFAARPV